MKAGSAQAESCVYVEPNFFASHARHNSIVVWLLGRSSCSSPYIKKLHALANGKNVLQHSSLIDVKTSEHVKGPPDVRNRYISCVPVDRAGVGDHEEKEHREDEDGQRKEDEHVRKNSVY